MSSAIHNNSLLSYQLKFFGCKSNRIQWNLFKSDEMSTMFVTTFQVIVDATFHDRSSYIACFCHILRNPLSPVTLVPSIVRHIF